MVSMVRKVRAGRDESAGGRVRFSEAARSAALERIAQVGAEGGSLAGVARELGVSDQTLRRWRAGQAPARLRAVRVSEDETPRGIVVLLPGGARVEGLDLEGLAELARRLS